ncbi:methyl-accepting chemotaxis protein [Paracidovorax valerianellae]|uniref:Methyl-accepting chemotaxis protein-1, serine sensor receptor n=1 Tax=Paracidovorax valerianellae TaxID=187868 RepID=A0A1G6WUZ0_9BURK|nr:methyl-accepting chemotaxis protein [Paracidovorax valerianellae]MDA8447638.1 methyl-accepting chemotaxis protein [Paracidovorax valerianellae]SDD68886.1 methyl-accepting chemotaxis protein-1, serine sensor receptor [Paracidovorax valerianellae]
MSVRNLTVRAQLTLSFGVLALLVLLASSVAVWGLNGASENFNDYVHGVNMRAKLAEQVRTAVDSRAIAARNLVLVTTPADIALEKAAALEAHKTVQESLGKLKETVSRSDVPPAVKNLVTEIDKVEQAYGKVALDIINLAVSGQREQATTKMNAECRPLLAALIAKTNEYAVATDKRAAAMVKEAEEEFQWQRSLLLGACLLAFAAAAAAGVLITRSLTRALGAEPAELSLAAQRVAEGDLSDMQGLANARAGSVLASLGTMQKSLVAIVAEVRHASDSIATGSMEISTGNTDLSQRTEEQASSLEQVASTMEEFSTTVRNNADNAKQADQLAQNAATVATHGGGVVTQVVKTMKDINDSSRQISDIIGVIDSIAFQTNILALNAAVEAARAGEQGRGFAVVASEVRNLAGRSAEAAKQIKSLIGTSVERVSQGTELVDQAGRTMQEVVSAIQRVTEMVAQIRGASAEQSTGVGQISQAISQIDQTTQQNAALVEESAAAAQSLEQQTRRLVDAVAIFKLDTHAALPAAIPTASLPPAAGPRGPAKALPAYGARRPALA